MEDLIEVVEVLGTPTVSSIIVAERLDIQHKNVLELIKKHLKTIEKSFGRVALQTHAFETAGGWQHRSVNYLTEDQALFVSTLARNTEKVVDFKALLVKSFQKARLLNSSFEVPTTFAQALQLAANQALQIEKQSKQLELAQPKVEFYDAVTDSKDTVDIGTVAKTLNYPGMGRTKLFSLLRDQKVLMQNNSPYQHYVDRGWFRIIETKYAKPDGSQHVNFKTVVFQKGIEGIKRIIDNI